jgi:23S rRNA pseudouridine2605 synthase
LRPPNPTSKRSQAKRTPDAVAGGDERLQRVISRLGLASRRAAEALIEQGRVQVDGRPARLGQKLLAGQSLVVDGQSLSYHAPSEKPRILVYHKPVGEIVSRDDPKGRATVFENLPRISNGQWISVGRLDFNTSGLLIFTTSGDVANSLMHPRNGFLREYAVRVRGVLSPQDLQALLKGISLADGPARFEKIEPGGGAGSNHWYLVSVREGRNREVRRLFEGVGYVVSRLIRTRFGPIELPKRLRPGAFLELRADEVARLMKLIDIKPEA